MNIWIINHYAVPPDYPGGTRHYYFAKQLIQQGHEVTIIAANYNHFSHQWMTPALKKQSQKQIHDGIPFIFISTPAYHGNTTARFWNMLVFSWRLLNKKYLSRHKAPDIIIGSSPHLFSAFSAALLARSLKKPFILEIRDLWPESLIELGRLSSKHPLIKLMKTIERYLYRHADHIISLLPGAIDYLKLCGVNEKKILWLPNAIDTDMVSNVPIYSPEEKFTVMYAGAHGLANDLETILKAAKLLQMKELNHNIRICLVGEGPDKARLKQIAQHENLTIVEFIDAVPKNQIYAILNTADAYLMLLKKSPVFRWGISPNKLFDYLIMARPIIFGVETTYNPVETCQSGITMKTGCHHSLAEAIEKLYRMPANERAAMGARGKAYVLKYHHIQYLADKLMNTIAALK